MTVNERTFDAPPAAVWEALSDGWLYPLWVVGASRMRAVDDAWPQVGSRLHHSVGVWPLLIDDNTEVLANEPLRRLHVRAKGWPLGEADVVIELEDRGSSTLVRIAEDAAEGPGKLVPKPVLAPMLKWRNTETLRRLALLVEGRTADTR